MVLSLDVLLIDDFDVVTIRFMRVIMNLICTNNFEIMTQFEY